MCAYKLELTMKKIYSNYSNANLKIKTIKTKVEVTIKQIKPMYIIIKKLN